MKYNEIDLIIEGQTQEVKFRLTAGNCVALEDKTKKSVIEFVQDESITMIVTMLRYMRMWELPQFSKEDAQKLYDTLVDNGYTYKRIIQDVVYETLVASGFLEEAEWTKIKTQTEEAAKRLIEKQEKAIASI